MTQAFLDTTILADATLKDRDTRRRIAAVLQSFAATEFPQYAIKEFNAGPLDHYKWLHNVLAEERSLERSVARLQAMSRTPRRNRTSTALEALRRALQESSSVLSDDACAEDLRVHLKRVIFSSWDELPRLVTRVTHLLDCYEAVGPHELPDGVMIALGPTKCKGSECSLAKRFHSYQKELDLLANAIRQQPIKAENTGRLGAIGKLQALEQLEDSECRALGDAVFALLAPEGFVILTTNIRDHKPLAEALGKEAKLP